MTWLVVSVLRVADDLQCEPGNSTFALFGIDKLITFYLHVAYPCFKMLEQLKYKYIGSIIHPFVDTCAEQPVNLVTAGSHKHVCHGSVCPHVAVPGRRAGKTCMHA